MMSEQLIPKTTYLVSVGNLFVSNQVPLLVTKSVEEALEFELETANQVANDIDGKVICKTVEYARRD